MKKLIAILFVLVLLIGCSQNQGRGRIVKNFFEGTITYHVDPEANAYMSKIERLLTYVYEKEELPDMAIVPVYRNADADKNRVITLKEAETFYQNYLNVFEDGLGQVKYKIPSPE